MRLIPALLIAPLLGEAAMAQSGAPLETELDFEAVTVITPLSDEDADSEIEPALVELSFAGRTTKVLDNGVRLRGRLDLRVQTDHPSRPGGTGGFGDAAFAPVGAFSGLSSATPIETSETRTRLESAYFQVDGGYGEVRIGKDQGVTARFHEGAKSVLSHARLDSTLLDPTGLATIRTRHDLTGPSAKLSYASPRILGVRAGVSVTPEASADGLDRRPAAGTGGAAPNIENAIELALNGSRKLRSSDLRIDLSLGWSKADTTSVGVLSPYETVETWSAGTRIEAGDWTLGASWLGSDNGLPDADYTAWSVGLHKDAWDTEFSIEYGESEDKGVSLESSGLRLGAARDLTSTIRLGAAYFMDETETIPSNQRSRGVVVEITLSEEILKLTGN